VTLRELATEGKSKDPENVSLAIPIQGILFEFCNFKLTHY
jgi:hypothetical protein